MAPPRHRAGPSLCWCQSARRKLPESPVFGSVVPTSTRGWLCVHCGVGRYLNGRCTKCAVPVPAMANIPVGAKRNGEAA